MEFGDIYRRSGDRKKIDGDNVNVKIEWLSGQARLDTKLSLINDGTYAVVRDRDGNAIVAVRLHLDKNDIENRSETIDKIWTIDAMDLLHIDH